MTFRFMQKAVRVAKSLEKHTGKDIWERKQKLGSFWMKSEILERENSELKEYPNNPSSSHTADRCIHPLALLFASSCTMLLSFDEKFQQDPELKMDTPCLDALCEGVSSTNVSRQCLTRSRSVSSSAILSRVQSKTRKAVGKGPPKNSLE
eukprot:979502-Rhodomonas_salina.1